MMEIKPTEALSNELPVLEGDSRQPHSAPGLPTSFQLIPFLSTFILRFFISLKIDLISI